MKSLSDCYLFNEFLSNPKIAKNIKSIDINRDAVSINDLEEPLYTINKKFTFPTKNQAIKLLNDNKITLIMNPEIALPRYLNTFGKMINGRPVIITDISKYAVKRSNGIEIFPKTLFGLMQNSMVLSLLISDWNKYTNNMSILKNGAVSYSRLFLKILDKQYAINIEPVRSDILAYITAKFFLVNMCGKKPNDTVNNLAYTACYNDTKLMTILEYESLFDDDWYKDISTLFKNLAKLNGLTNINFRSFFEQYLRMYGEGTALSLEYLPSFLGMIFSANIGCNLHKDFIIDSVSGKTNNKLYVDFCKLI